MYPQRDSKIMSFQIIWYLRIHICFQNFTLNHSPYKLIIIVQYFWGWIYSTILTPPYMFFYLLSQKAVLLLWTIFFYLLIRLSYFPACLIFYLIIAHVLCMSRHSGNNLHINQARLSFNPFFAAAAAAAALFCILFYPSLWKKKKNEGRLPLRLHIIFFPGE